MKKLKAFWYRLKICYHLLFKEEYIDWEKDKIHYEKFRDSD